MQGLFGLEALPNEVGDCCVGGAATETAGLEGIRAAAMDGQDRPRHVVSGFQIRLSYEALEA